MMQPFYDPTLSYEENFDAGPFGQFANQKKIKRVREPSANFLGHRVYLPFGIPAGPLINAKFVTAAFSKGYDLCVYKTVRTRSYPCHPHPNVLAVHSKEKITLQQAAQGLVADEEYGQPLSITNSFGVPSKDPDFWQADMQKAVRSAGKGQLVIGSFQGTRSEAGNEADFINDYVTAAKLVKETGVSILEANLSCPNECSTDLVCFSTEQVQKIARAIKKAVGDTPLILKIAYFEDQAHLAQLIKAVAPIVQGIASINTIPGKIVTANGEQALPGEGRLVSGICGAGVKWAGLEMVKRLVKLRMQLKQDFTIIGVGGVTSVQDYFQYKKAGADVVMSATGAMWNPLLAQEIYQKGKNE